MATLHNATEMTKKLLFWLGVGIGCIILLVIIVQFIISLIPKKIIPPTVTFGPLPAIPFPPNTITKNFVFSINTVTGSLPILPDRATVYKVQQPAISLLSLDQAKDLVMRNGFPDNSTKLSDTLYQWQQVNTPFAKISYDIVSLNYNFLTNYLTDPIVAVASNLPDQPGAIESAQNFVTSFNSNVTDIDTAKTQVTRYSIQNATLVPASSIATTQAMQVDFYQKDLNKIPIYYPNYPHSTMNVVIASVNYPNLVAQAKYFHQTVMQDENATYPIKTADEAFKELHDGQAYIANYDGVKTTILIQDMHLAFLASETPQQYLMPIIVFQGNDNFYAFVSAVKDAWI